MVIFWLHFVEGFQSISGKKDSSMYNNGISALRTCIVGGIVGCYEYLFTILTEWIRITCKT